jgi:type I restriction enzyme S subunit
VKRSEPVEPVIPVFDKKHLPSHWKAVPIGEICAPVKKVNPKEEPVVEFNYIDISGINNDQFRIAETKKYIGRNAPSRARQLVQTGDIVFSTVRTYLKNIARVTPDLDGQIASTGFCVLRAAQPEYSGYLYYYMLYEPFLNELAKFQRGTSYPAVRDGDLFAQFIPVPPKNEAVRIVAEIEKYFSRLDEAVAGLKRVKANLKRYKAAVLKAAVEGKLVPTEALRGAVESPPGRRTVKLGEVIKSMKNGIYKPRNAYADDGIACLRMYNIENGKIVWKDIKRMKLTRNEVLEYQLLPGDLLVNRVNSRELVGKAAPIPSGLEPCVFESKNIRVRLNHDIADSRFIGYAMSVFGPEHFNRNAQQVVGMASVSQPQVSALPIHLPPLTEQQRIAVEVERRLSMAEELEKEVTANLQRAERLRQAILSRAFSGKLMTLLTNLE